MTAVRIVEREAFPRFVIGESLLPRCMDLLREADLLAAVDARNYLRKDGATFLSGGRRRDFVFQQQHTPGWSYTYQVPRADFDQTLLRAVEERGAQVFQRHAVVDVEPGASPRVTVEAPDRSRHCVRARFIIDASGYGRVLPRLLKLDKPSHLPERQALFSWVTRDRREPGIAAGRTWVCLHPGGAWIWVIPFADGQTSVGVVAGPEFFSNYPTDPSARLRAILSQEPNAQRRLGDAPFAFEPRTIRGYSIAVERMFAEGYCLVGNSGEFLDPVFSSGVTLALESAVRAGQLVARSLRGERVDFGAQYAAHVAAGIDTFRTYVDAWYDGTLQTLMFSDDPPALAQQQITSVLAGYVWDRSNPFVSDGKRRLNTLARAIDAGLHL